MWGNVLWSAYLEWWGRGMVVCMMKPACLSIIQSLAWNLLERNNYVSKVFTFRFKVYIVTAISLCHEQGFNYSAGSDTVKPTRDYSISFITAFHWQVLPLWTHFLLMNFCFVCMFNVPLFLWTSITIYWTSHLVTIFWLVLPMGLNSCYPTTRG